MGITRLLRRDEGLLGMNLSVLDMIPHVVQHGQDPVRDRPVSVTIDVALGYIDDLEIELIAPRSPVSPYHDTNGRLLVGMHHVAWFTGDLQASILQASQRGLQPMFEAGNPVTRVAYLESSTVPGLRIEYIQYTADGLAGWQQRVEAARTWNGKDPIQVYDLAG